MIDKGEAVSRQVDILRSTGELSPAEIEAIAIRLQEYAEESAKPVPVRVLLGAGGWLAASFLALSVLQGSSLLPGGVVLLGTAAGLSRTARGTFFSHLALALACAGNIGILAAVAPDAGGEIPTVMPVLQLFLCLILYPLVPHVAFRFAAPISVAALTILWIAEREGAFWIFHPLVAAELILFLALILNERRIPPYFPLEKAAALLLPATLLSIHLVSIFTDVPLWPSGLLLCGALIAVLLHPAVGLPALSPSRSVGLTAAFLFLGLFISPGIPAALLLLVLGRAREELYLTALGGLFLPVFIGFQIQALDIDPVWKAWVIAGSGLLLLGLRKMAARCRPGE